MQRDMPADLAACAGLPPGIEVWQYCLAESDVEMDAGLLAAARAQLSSAERSRMDALVRPADRRRYALAHAILRLLLARRLDCPPSRLDFSVGPFGKPRLAHYDGLHFNLSHAGDYVLLALSEQGEVGIDIEYRDPGLDVGNLAELAWSERERRDGQIQPCDFFARWTGKEAVLKALGVGIGEHLQALSIHPRADGSYAIAHDQAGWAEVQACQLVSPPGYAAAVAWLSTH
ncbi:4'-phosphopantetheinyl transferase family protein [Herbaspirillum camelliae]|uniref:4'-phosphopantetheinyl transferase family protein n=1 Tax=Herbaspirillum camelliae TaxID=1892903 RepID=UPI000B0211A1|nr:4'-phosphopantetheinyl transferase superfamily protein [Herbaspirillum camelliae]